MDDLVVFPKEEASKVSHDPGPGCGRPRLWSVLRHMVVSFQQLSQHFDTRQDLRAGVMCPEAASLVPKEFRRSKHACGAKWIKARIRTEPSQCSPEPGWKLTWREGKTWGKGCLEMVKVSIEETGLKMGHPGPPQNFLEQSKTCPWI